MIPLNIVSSYSLLKSTIRIPELVQYAKTLGYQAIALADEHVLYGAVEFYRYCLKENIQPILGVQLDYVRVETSSMTYSVTVLAKNNIGYQALIELSTLQMIHKKPLTREQLVHYQNDLIFIFPDHIEHNEFLHLFVYQQDQKLEESIAFWKSHVHAQHLYMMVSPEHIQEALSAWKTPTAWLTKVAGYEIMYLKPTDVKACYVLQAIKSGESCQLHQLPNASLKCLLDPKEMAQPYIHAGVLDWVKATQDIAKMCDVSLSFDHTYLPKYHVPQGFNADQYLLELCYQGLKDKHLVQEAYEQRLNHELTIISQMDFSDYFLIIWDVVRFARSQNMVIGPGRGSAAGSLVAYLLTITDVDPLKYHLFFERFLNPERQTMPDIDLDIPDQHRETILNYLYQTYGAFHVAQIITFGTMAAKMALRDVCRALGRSVSEANRWTKTIPNQLKITLDEAYQQSYALQKLVQESQENKDLFHIAKQLEGLPRHSSTHAAGVVMSDVPLTRYIPLQKGHQMYMTQYTMYDIERIGLLKMDFLGLKNLSLLEHMRDWIQEHIDETFSLTQIPLDDPKTYQLFQKGETLGIFQFESSGIQQVLRKLKPVCLEDLAAVNALYRPGPMEYIDEFISRKEGRTVIQYPEPILEPILKETYGIIVYQEQIMQIAVVMAGYSLGEADILRRAISKKNKALLDQQRDSFVRHAHHNGFSITSAERVYDYIERFANYGFNRSHAVAYSIIGYQMAYIKVHYPIAFYKALLPYLSAQPEKLSEALRSLSQENIAVYPPHINYSDLHLSEYEGHLYMGLQEIKGFRKDWAKAIFQERQQQGPFQSLEDFLMRLYRVGKSWVSVDNLKPLVYSGALDSFQTHRKSLMLSIEHYLDHLTITAQSPELAHLFPMKKISMTEDFSALEKLEQEYEVLGHYISNHPTQLYQQLKKYYHINRLSNDINGSHIYLVYVTYFKEIKTKKGDLMAFVTIEDKSKSVDGVLFPKVYQSLSQPLSVGQVYLVYGKQQFNQKRNEEQFIIDAMILADTLCSYFDAGVLYLKLTEHKQRKDVLHSLSQFPGVTPVILVDDVLGTKELLSSQFWITLNESLLSQLRHLLGSNYVQFIE